MDFKFTKEEEKFRHEVRDFIRKELPRDWNGVGFNVEDEFSSPDILGLRRSMARKLGEKGWLALSWPKQYGGQGRSHMEQLIFNEEVSYNGVPGVDIFGVGMIGPTLMAHGSEEQKKEHLGYIARGERFWCQGFSEPNAGSDLASLQTRGVVEGDQIIINGQKVWTTGAHFADWCFALVRTDQNAPKHKGITMVLADMKWPGIQVRPLYNMVGKHSFNEIFFDNLKVPLSNVVGGMNKGWEVANALLEFERSGIWRVASSLRLVEEMVKYANETKVNDGVLAQDPLIRQKLAQLMVEVEVAKMLAYRVGWMQSNHQTPAYEASMSKLFGSELQLKTAEIGLQILGLYAQLKEGDKRAPLWGRVEQWYMSHLGRVIAAGSSEIQRNIIAWRGLGLPR